MLAMARLRFSIGEEIIEFQPDAAALAGFSGRESSKVQQHIDELVKLGVPAPSQVPTFYPVLPDQLTQSTRIDVIGGETSGEAEVALLVDKSGSYVAVASDHTDRLAERIDVGLSKRLCPKILSRRAWPLSQVMTHWDSIELRSWVDRDAGGLAPYQLATLSQLLSVEALSALIPWRRIPANFVLLCGTVPTLDGLHCGRRFRAELHDPVLSRTLALEYVVRVHDALQT